MERKQEDEEGRDIGKDRGSEIESKRYGDAE